MGPCSFLVWHPCPLLPRMEGGKRFILSKGELGLRSAWDDCAHNQGSGITVLVTFCHLVDPHHRREENTMTLSVRGDAS